jgi:hypothetical protein
MYPCVADQSIAPSTDPGKHPGGDCVTHKIAPASKSLTPALKLVDPKKDRSIERNAGHGAHINVVTLSSSFILALPSLLLLIQGRGGILFSV